MSETISLQVLVVDPNLDSRELLTTLLEMHDIEVFAATSVDEAMAVIQQQQLDLIISEILLSREDGYALIRKVKAYKIEQGVEIPAIALTTYAMESDRLRVLASGFCEYLTKPTDIDELIATVARVTGKELEMPISLYS